MRYRIPIVVGMMVTGNMLWGQTPKLVTSVTAVRTTEPIHIDGVLSESIWQRPGVTQFFQQDPHQGKAVSESTEVWVAYDDKALYIAARMKDSHPDSIIARLSRRDNDVGADFFGVAIDSYHDKRNGFYFVLTAGGTQIDGIEYNDDWSDATWDGVWEAKRTITSEGWNVEMRIPFSQLRFKPSDQYVWGIDFERYIGRKKEGAYLAYTPRDQSGFVSRFPELLGVEHITPPARIEILPYVNERAEYSNPAAADPFNNGSKYTTNVGADIKYGLGSNMILEGSVNPDFGQVEVDPAVVNLSDVETYYSEKRPFFLEGMNIFSFGQGGVNSFWGFNWSSPSIFYSRRIGRAPERSMPSYDYADIPIAVHILGATKITGKVSDGWNVGAIEAVTRREFADIDSAGVKRNLEVEPLTLYSIERIQKDFNDGKQGVGMLFTAANRSFDDMALKSDVNDASYLCGLDGWTALDTGKVYMVSGWAAGSYVEGSHERMINLQRNSAHYFQRPDASYLSVDSNAASLSGYAGRITLNKQKGSVMLNSAFGIVSPGFDCSDLGYFSRTDIINYHIAGGYKWSDPTSWYRYINLYGSYFETMDFGGTPTWRGLWTQMTYQLPNYHTCNIAYDYGFPSFSDFLTRGGPRVKNIPTREWSFDYWTDSRDQYTAELYYYGNTSSGFYNTVSMPMTMRPVSNISISLSPAYTLSIDHAHYIDTYNDASASLTNGLRCIFADLDYKELSAQFRVDWTLRPTLSLQVFVQPFFSAGDFTNYKMLRQSRTLDFVKYGEEGSTIIKTIGSDGSVSYNLSPDGNPDHAVSESNPNFNFVSLRGNAVLRWEYMPGSTLYFVWTQTSSYFDANGDFDFHRTTGLLGNAKPDNIFIIKLSYWISS
ncbi:MAG TPA: DUF5916 domain-containing protein [Bacteroidota bacterium]|nr:DUF5916 domain-containing protein [Bacteroidota bacterium]